MMTEYYGDTLKLAEFLRNTHKKDSENSIIWKISVENQSENLFF